MFFLRSGHDFGGSRGLPEAASKTLPNKTPKRQRLQSILGGYFGAFWVPNLISCILFVTTFMLMFGIAFGRPPVAIQEIWESVQGPF